MEFNVGDHVFLKVSPTKGVMRFGKKGKLSLRFVGHFVILERINKVAYRIAFLPQLSNMHNVLHVFMLLRYEQNPSHVLTQDEIPIRDDLTYVEKAILILDKGENVLKNKVSLVKVLWNIHTIAEAT